MRSKELFSGQGYYDYANSRKEDLKYEIQSFEMDAILSTPLAEIEKIFEDRFMMHPPKILSDELYSPEFPKETSTVEKVPARMWGEDEYCNVAKNYIRFTICVPFEGDASLLTIRPTRYQTISGRQMNASIIGTEIHLSYNEEANDIDELEKKYMMHVNLITTNSQHLASDAKNFNKEISIIIKRELDERKQSAEKSRSIIKSFKIPIKKRNNIPATYTIPDIQRKPKILERPKTKKFTPEPTLDVETYEEILTIIKDMALAMERSPKTFASLREEDIRNFFIILLNGHYQGAATGETFNGDGKTDILIRYNNENAFIGECKFWNGQKKLRDTIDQLLSYVTWRDTKTSIILFNKQTDLSSVINKADQTLQDHQYHKSKWKFTNEELEALETIHGYKFVHPSDSEKEIFLTLMAFQINEP